MASTLTVDSIVGATTAGTVKVPGAMIQTVTGKLTTQLAVDGVSGATDYFVDIGLNASITPKFSNSNILITVTMFIAGDTGNSGFQQMFRIHKGASPLTESHGDGAGNRKPVAGYINHYTDTTGYRIGYLGGTYIDTNVGTTNATTYSIHCRSYSDHPMIFINRTNVYGNTADYEPTPQSTITLQEIAV